MSALTRGCAARRADNEIESFLLPSGERCDHAFAILLEASD